MSHSGATACSGPQDDIAKVAKLLVVDHGATGGQQVLHPGLLDATLQRDPADRGLTTSGTDRRSTTTTGSGPWTSTASDDPAYASPFSVPFMSGYGGITVTLMPNGSSYYVFSDNNEFGWSATVMGVEQARPDGRGRARRRGRLRLGRRDRQRRLRDRNGRALDRLGGGRRRSHRRTARAQRQLEGAHERGGDGGSLATLSQTVTIPAGCTNAQLRLWLRIVSDEVLANVYDKLDLTVTDADGDSTRLVRWSNMDEQEYTLETIPLGEYAGQTITLTFTGDENLRRATWFAIDDFGDATEDALGRLVTVSQSSMAVTVRRES